MRILIAYFSRTGSTESLAAALADKLKSRGHTIEFEVIKPVVYYSLLREVSRVARADLQDKVFKSKEGKFQAVARDIKERYNGNELTMVSPDVGGVVRARAMAKRLDADLAIIDKRRERAGHSEVMNIIGDVGGRDCILVDDIVDSAGTLCNAAEALMDQGAKSVSAYVSHGVLSGGAVSRVSASPLETLTITDSILATEAVRVSNNIRQITISPLMGEAVRRIHDDSSVSSLFD